MKEKWFQFIIDNKEYWTNGMTVKRLQKVKSHVFEDEPTMSDLLNRHGAIDKTPEEMKLFDRNLFDHCIGNFVCNIHYIMMDRNIIKG